jgi:hypothetical protein
MSIATSIEKIKNNNEGPCLTIILPTHKTAPERTVDPIEMKKTLAQVKDDIVMMYGKPAEELCSKLDGMYESIDFNHNLEGIGLYVSPVISEIVHFPFDVTKKISVGQSFLLRELISMEAYFEDYFLLDISLEEVKLFRGSGKQLNMIQNKDFPKKFDDDYEYQRSQPLGVGHGYGQKNPEGDKSVIIEERFEKFLKDIDRTLTPYLKNNELLILAGVKQELGYFQKVSEHNDKVAGKVIGSHAHTNLPELAALAFEQVSCARKEIIIETVKDIEEQFGRELAVTGIDNTWRAAREGKGRLLVVEKDYIQKAFRKPGVEHLFLSPPAEVHEILDDAVERVIKTVLEKDGEVIITENGVLDKFEKIALLLRYA